MAKTKNKRQRKFEAKHLQGAIKRRKHLQHVKRKRERSAGDGALLEGYWAR